MPDRLEIDPAVLRQLEQRHRQVAQETREWAQPPTDWLRDFEPTYGKIARPVKRALERYYKARQEAGEALALEHERTADSLRASADSYERTDAESAASINRHGDEFYDSPGSSAPSSPTATSPVGEPVAGPVTGPGAGTSGSPSNGVVGSVPGGTMPGAGAAGSEGASAPSSPGSVTPSIPSMPPTDTTAGTNGSASPAAASAGPAAPAGGIPPSTVGGLPVGAMGSPSGGPGYLDDRQVGQPPIDPGANGTPMPVAPTPFGAAVESAKDKAAAPDYIVGEEVNEDLVIARTLLGAVLAAVEPTVGMTWAVSVMRGPAGAGVFITSNEGRGWLPAGLYLPREVSTPWMWDELLRTEDSSGSPWEGVSDPARILVEFGLAWGTKANAQLSALVSSGQIDPGLRVHLNDVAMEGMVGPSYDVDLRVFTPDTVDRLGLTGSVPALESVAATPDTRVRARCLELAVDAQAQLIRSVAAPPESGGVRAIRDRILAWLQSGSDVPREWWDELRDADDLLAVTMISRRVDVGRVGLGELRVDDEASVMRALAWERRCNELVMLLDQEEESRQMLRDAVYAHEQVVQHPSFVAAPAPVSTVEGERVERPAATSGAVSAPEQRTEAAAGPTGVSVPSGTVSPPPVVTGPPAGTIGPLVSPPPGVERG
ncbi:type VII secretion target [Nocardia brevicatena]|uniref:type VII secretion target n=1 Tax=Nocardia brevicatena TaxID=37327 RepID=UPI00059273DB|nr:type VII secretion target [Nocardia brevicatena]